MVRSFRLQAEVTVIVPCWNEEAGLPSLIQRLDRLIVKAPRRWEVIFVDDGSTDGTPAILDGAASERAWVKVIRHTRNLGLGAALRTGFGAPLAPRVCTVDSDCTYPPEKLPEMLDILERGADLVTASPWHPANRSVEGSRLRVAMSRGVSRIYRTMTGAGIHTYTCLFRAYRQEVIEHVPFTENGFPAVAELLVRAVLSGYRVEELPLPLTERRHGASSISLPAAIGGHLRLLGRTARWRADQLRAREGAPA